MLVRDGKLISNSDIDKVRKDFTTKVNSLGQKASTRAIVQVLNINNVGVYFPAKYNKIENMEILEPLKFKKVTDQIEWLKRWFILNSELINQFVLQSSIIESLFIQGNYKDALDETTVAENNFGITLWGIQNKIVALHSLGEMDEVSQYFTSILSKNRKIGIFAERYMAKSKYGNYDLFIDSLYSHIYESREGVNSPYSDYLSFLLLPTMLDRERSLSNVLQIISRLPLIDQYIFFRLILSEYFIRGNTKERKTAMHALREMSNNIEDKTLSNAHLHCLKKFQYSDDCLKILSKYNLGKYQECIDLIETILASSPSETQYIELLAKCYVYEERKHTKKDNVLDIIISLFIETISVQKNCSQYLKDIEGILVQHFPQRWTIPIFSQLYNLFKYSNQDKKVTSVKYQAYLGCKVTPKYSHIVQQPNINCSEYTKNLLKESGHDCGLTGPRSLKYLFDDKIRNNVEGIREDILSKFKVYDGYYLPFEILMMQAELNLKQKDYRKALEVVLESCITNIETFRCFPLGELAELIENYKIPRDRLQIPILMYIYSQNVDHTKKMIFDESFEDYMDSKEEHQPSRMYCKSRTFDTVDAFFLNNVCTISNMYFLPSFESSSEVKVERIRIIDLLREYLTRFPNLLSEVDLLRERAAIMDDLIVSEGKTKYDMHKVYVDIDSIAFLKSSEFNVLYDTYNSISEKGTDTPIILKSINKLAITNPKSRALFDYAKRFIHQFVKNPDYGLDKCLSTEIRHGVFKSHVRHSFEHATLITDQRNKKYEDNSRWLSKYEVYFDAEDSRKFLEIMSFFSHQIDKSIKDAHNWMKVTFDHDRNDRLFKFNLSPKDYELLKRELYKCENYNQTIQVLKTYCMKRLTTILEQVVDKLNEDFKKDVDDATRNLKFSLSEMKTTADFGELYAEIDSSKTSFIHDLKTVSDWFNISKNHHFNKQTLSTTINIAKKCFEAVKPHKKINYNFNIDNTSCSKYIKGNEVKAMITSLIAAFNNSLKYGKYRVQPKINLTCKIAPDQSYRIRIYNTYDRESNESTRKANFDRIKSDMNSSFNEEKIFTEGGTGLYKINHLLSIANPKTQVDVEDYRSKYFSLLITGNYYENSNNRR